VDRGDFTAPDRLTVVERRLYELEARLIAAEQKVYAPKIVPLAGSQEAREASRKALAEAEQKMLETAVEIESDEWEAKWMDL